jgi:hypothetical protein
MATLLGPAEPEVRVAAEAAREILTRLEAKPFLERLEEATKRQSPTPASERRGHRTHLASEGWVARSRP